MLPDPARTETESAKTDKVQGYFSMIVTIQNTRARAPDPIPPRPDPHPDPSATRPTCFSTTFVDFTARLLQFHQSIVSNQPPFQLPASKSTIRPVRHEPVAPLHPPSLSVICRDAASTALHPDEVQFVHRRPSISLLNCIPNSPQDIRTAQMLLGLSGLRLLSTDRKYRMKRKAKGLISFHLFHFHIDVDLYGTMIDLTTPDHQMSPISAP
ncbi:hypothetical protein LXL04_007434 [Taraxacum kok-saghyz]